MVMRLITPEEARALGIPKTVTVIGSVSGEQLERLKAAKQKTLQDGKMASGDSPSEAESNSPIPTPATQSSTTQPEHKPEPKPKKTLKELHEKAAFVHGLINWDEDTETPPPKLPSNSDKPSS